MCPMTTGAMKQTVVDGRWIHTVCALYLARVSWDDPQTMAPIILRDVPPQSWGSQVEDSWCYPFPESPPPCLVNISNPRPRPQRCELCPDDDNVAGTGVCLACDAGFCPSRFHASCAHRCVVLLEASRTMR